MQRRSKKKDVCVSKSALFKDEIIIKKITKIRTDNNIAWMAVLKLAFIHAPIEARKLMQQITKNDMAVSKLSARLGTGGTKK